MKIKTLHKIRTNIDQELRVEHIRVEGQELFRVTDFVPSTSTEGTGVAMTLSTLVDLTEALQQVCQYHGVGQGEPGDNQPVLF